MLTNHKDVTMTLKKSIKKITLAAAFICAFNAQAIDVSTTFDQGIKYLEYNLLVQPNNKINHINGHINAGAALAFAGLSGIELYKNDSVEYKNLFKPAVIAGIAATIYYKAISCFVKRSIYTNNLISFVSNWSHHKAHTAEAFHELFDALAQLLETQGENAIAAEAGKVMELIMFHMTHELKDRYKTSGLKPFEGIKILTDVIKNAQGILG